MQISQAVVPPEQTAGVRHLLAKVAAAGRGEAAAIAHRHGLDQR
jgi:hypothetical protein